MNRCDPVVRLLELTLADREALERQTALLEQLAQALRSSEKGTARAYEQEKQVVARRLAEQVERVIQERVDRLEEMARMLSTDRRMLVTRRESWVRWARSAGVRAEVLRKMVREDLTELCSLAGTWGPRRREHGHDAEGSTAMIEAALTARTRRRAAGETSADERGAAEQLERVRVEASPGTGTTDDEGAW